MKALIGLLAVFISLLAVSQSTDVLEDRLKAESGFEKLATLNQLTISFNSTNERKARKYSRQAYILAENFTKSDIALSGHQTALVVGALNQFGISQYERANYLDAKGIFEKISHLSGLAEMAGERALATDYIAKIDSAVDNSSIKENFFTKKLTDINVGNMVSNTNNSVGVAFELKMARVSENKKDTLQAISHYQKAADLLRDKGEFEKAEEIESKIKSYREVNELEAQLESLKMDVAVAPIKPIIQQNDSLVSVDQTEATSLKDQAEQLEANKDFEAALAYYKEYTALQRKWEKDSLEREAQRTVVLSEMDRLKQQNEIADLNIAAIQLEKEAEIRLKNALYIGLIAIGVAALVAIILYISKRKKHRQLSIAYEDLDAAKVELQNAKQHISKLLEQQVSPEIASALIEEAQEKKKQFVAVMFLDIRGFTPIAEKLEPKELIEYQNNIFGFMIEIIQKYHGNINQFMGDGFMATFGAPKSHGNDVRNAFLASSEILEGLDEINAKGTIPLTKVGIGIHAGNVVTGNVGTESRKQFSVTGNTVIIAARIEQLNKSYDSSMIVSSEVMEYLEEEDTKNMYFQLHETHVKGRTDPIKISVFNEAEVNV